MGLDPEKLRRFLAEQLQNQQAPSPQAETAGAQTGEPTQPAEEEFNFDLKPEELEAYLDQYVIRQHQAKAILATKICTHFNCLRLPADEDDDLVGSIKNNVLMIGPTGVGKTYLIKLIARRLGVPFVKGDATKFSETGYVGGDVEDLVRELVREADGNIERAQYGIVYIDEIDKIASSQGSYGPDVSRSGVQRNLLKLMEETEVDLKAPHDIASQMETVMQMQRTGKLERQKINTRHILFIVSGAFSGLEDLIARRLNQGSMGFRLQADGPDRPPVGDREELLRQVRAEDLIEYGFESEFIGRLPVVAVLHSLSKDDLLEILRSPKSSVVLAKKRDFRAYGIDIDFSDEALELLAERAHAESTGARGLVSAIEKVLIHFEKKLPSTEVRHFGVSADIVRDPDAGLRRLLQDTPLEGYAEEFHRTHGIALHFEPEAAERLAEMARERGQTPGALCAELFSDYGYGLKLTGQDEFTIPLAAVHQPRDYLNGLIREYYSRRQG